MQSQAHAAVRPGGLTARCVQSAPVFASPPSTSAVRGTPIIVWHGWFARGGSWRAPEFWAGKSCTFRKSRQDFQNKHVHPPPTTSPERNRFVSIFRAISRKRSLCWWKATLKFSGALVGLVFESHAWAGAVGCTPTSARTRCMRRRGAPTCHRAYT